MNIDEMISKYEINIAYSDEDEGYIARVIDVPEFEFNVAFGETREEALKELEWVMKSVIEIRIKEVGLYQNQLRQQLMPNLRQYIQSAYLLLRLSPYQYRL
jgi:predicted RNase H-like HicB family nuclease